MRYRLAFLLAAAGLIAAASAPPALAQTDGFCDVRSPSSTDPVPPFFPSIQSAIDNPLCLTIRLQATREDAPFREQIVIPRSLSIVGVTFKQRDEDDPSKIVTRLHPPSPMNGPNLITITGARTRVKIRHVVIEGTGAVDPMVGIRAPRDTRLTLRDCVFRKIRPPAPDGRWGFIGVHFGGPIVDVRRPGISSHSINLCRFDGYQTAAVVVQGQGTTAVVAQNLISGAAEKDVVKVHPATGSGPIGVLVFDGATVTVDHNNILHNSTADDRGAAVYIHRGAVGSVISYNNIDHNDLGVGIEGTHQVKIYRNGLTENGVGMAFGGAEASNSNTIQLNTMEKGGLGLLLGISSDNAISSNELTANSSHGALILSTSAKNKLYRTRTQNNGGLGIVDVSHGAGTKGTANFHTSNLCTGNNNFGPQSEPAGICAIQ